MITTQVHTYIDIKILQKYIKKNIDNSSQLLIQLFLISTDNMYIVKIQNILNVLLPDAHIIGTTTDGSISKDDAENTLISFTHFEKSTLKHTLVTFDLAKEDIAAKTIMQDLLSSRSKVLIIFADGLLCNGEKLSKEIHEEYPELIIAGGLAGDNAQLVKTFVCENRALKTQAIVALSIDSDSLYVHNDYNLAWEPVGLEMEITKAKDNIIYEIDGERASHIFDKHLNTKYLNTYDTCKSRPTISIEFPLMIKRDNMYVARTVMMINEDGSLFCTGEFMKGDRINFSFTDPEKIIQSGIEFSKKMLKIPVQSMFIYSCMARRRFMGENISYDLEPLYNIAPFSGFYSYGELFTTSKSIEFLNHTMTLLALSEENDIYVNKVNMSSSLTSHREETLNVLTKLIRNTTKESEESLEKLTETLLYNPHTKELFLLDVLLVLSYAEERFFSFLFKNKGSSVDTESIFTYIWAGKEKEYRADAIRTLVKKLRKKLPPDIIKNSYGGYYKLAIS